MRTFKIGAVEDRRFVVLEREGSQIRVIKGNADGSTRQSIKEFGSEAEADRAADLMAAELIARGYRERNSKDPAQPRTSRPAAAATANTAATVAVPSRPAPAPSSGGLDIDLLAEAAEGLSEDSALLPRLAPAPAAVDAAPKAKKKAGKRKKRRKQGGSPGQGDALDRRVVAGFVAAGLVLFVMVGFLGYKAFLEPPSIVGNWEGSRTEHEIGKYLTNTAYVLILDEQRRASMQVAESRPSVGTYTFQKDRLKLTLTDTDEDGEVHQSNVEYRASLGGATLDLYDLETGHKIVQLIRFHKKPVVGGGGGAGGKAPTPAPDALAAGPIDKAADEKLASVPFGAKDGAFALRHPAGWEPETGARADNTYSWVRVTKGSARVRIYADIAGSLMAGPNNSEHEEGSELAPVHGAHLRYKKDAAELMSNYEESPPATFKGSTLGEGRISTFTASGDGMFGGKVRGIRVTLMTNDRRVAILCDAPTKTFDAVLPTFLAVCRSLGR